MESSISSLYLVTTSIYFMVYTLVLLLYFELDKKKNFPDNWADYMKYMVAKWMLVLLPLVISNLTRYGISYLLGFEMGRYSIYYNETNQYNETTIRELEKLGKDLNNALQQQINFLDLVLYIFVIVMLVIGLMRFLEMIESINIKNKFRPFVLFILPLVFVFSFNFFGPLVYSYTPDIYIKTWFLIPIISFIYWFLLGIYFRKMGLLKPILIIR